jgi:hypothetical protein
LLFGSRLILTQRISRFVYLRRHGLGSFDRSTESCVTRTGRRVCLGLSRLNEGL